jgi:hypothetical protein
MLTRALKDKSVGAALAASLRELDAAALQFAALRVGGATYVAATVVDAEGDAHLVGLRLASPSYRTAATALFSDLLARGLRARRPVLVSVGRCDALAHLVRAAFGARAVMQAA